MRSRPPTSPDGTSPMPAALCCPSHRAPLPPPARAKSRPGLLLMLTGFAAPLIGGPLIGVPLALSLSGCSGEVLEAPAVAPSSPQGSGAAPVPVEASRRWALSEAHLQKWRAAARPGRPVLHQKGPQGELQTVIGLHQPLSLSPGDQPLPSQDVPAQALVSAFRDLMGPSLLLNDQDELELLQDRISPDGTRHLRLQQKRAGLPIYRARLHLHLRNGALTSFESSLRDTSHLLLTASVSLEKAISLAWDRHGLEASPTRAQELLFVGPEGVAERAYRLMGLVTAPESVGENLVSGPAALFISAVDGRSLALESLVQEVSQPPSEASSPGENATTNGASVAACTSPSELNCQLATTGVGDNGKTYNIQVYRGQGFALPTLLDGYLHPLTGEDYPYLYGNGTSTDSYFADLSTAGSQGALYIIQTDGSIIDPYDWVLYDDNDFIPSGSSTPFVDEGLYGQHVSAQSTIRAALRYYHERHGRAGISGDPAALVDVVARVGLSGLNAAWASDYNYMVYGSFAGQTLATAVDVSGHELTHGVIHFSADLGSSDQAGALNEALADIFGVTIETYATNALDWWIAEDIAKFPPLRNLKNPQWFDMPSHMSEYVVTEGDRGGIHTNMSIPTKAFQLAVEGTGSSGTFHGYSVPPADANRITALNKVADVLYHTLMYRVTPTSAFADWALGALASVDEVATDSTSADATYNSLRAAFLATGILTNSSGEAQVMLTGQVSDATSGQPIPGATVTLQLSTATKATTDARGVFWFTLDPLQSPATAPVSVEAAGYYGMTQSRALASLGQTSSAQLQADMRLTPRPPAELTYTLSASTLTLATNKTTTLQVEVKNVGNLESQLSWSIEPTIDYTSKEVPFAWVDVMATANPINLVGDQEHSDALPLGAAFPFYFKGYTNLYVSTDGYVTLEPDPTLYYREFPIPSPEAPRSLIAPYWTDLDFDDTPQAYFYYDGSRKEAWVQFDTVQDYDNLETYTFEVGLFPDGHMRFSYASISGTSTSWARAGIQNAAGTEGLEVCVSTPDSPSTLLVAQKTVDVIPSMPPLPGAVVPSLLSGLVMGGQKVTIPVTVSTASIPTGSYTFYLRLATNDVDEKLQRIPVKLVVP